MIKYALNPDPKKCVKVYGRALRISRKSSVTVCRAISGKSLKKGKALLEGMVEKKRDLNGKYYTNVATEILGLVKSSENNAEFKGLDTDKLIINASAHRGFTFYRPRKSKMGRMKRKMTNVQVVLSQA